MLIESWMKEMSNMKKAENTIKSYERGLNGFLLWEFDTLEDRTGDEYATVDIEEVYDYLNEKEFADSTKNLYQIAIHLFWCFLLEKKIISENKLEKIKLIKLEEPIPEPFTVDEVNAIYDKIQNSPFKRCALRDAAIMTLMLAIPVRKNEVIKLKRADYSERGNIIFRNRKGKKNTVVGCSRSIIVAIDRYLESRNDDCEYLFAREESDGPMGINAIDNVVWKYAECNPHKLRATAATMMYKSGVPLERIEQIGGWSKNSLTLRKNYIRIDEDDVREDLEATERFLASKKER